MRVMLLRNPKAGNGKHGRKELVNALGKAGHQTICRSIKKKGWKAALKKQTDVVVVAGGDGAIAKVASALIDRETPLAILPFGTANNLARSLGFFASPKEIIAQLKDRKDRLFDVGVAQGPWGRRFLFEGAARGCLPITCTRQMRRQRKRRKKKNERSYLKNKS